MDQHIYIGVVNINLINLNQPIKLSIYNIIYPVKNTQTITPQIMLFLRKQGLRIDHFLLPPSTVDKLDKCYIDSKLRGLEKPSDHVPIVCEFKL